ncbi:Similar to pol: RNA-directed DNA polymerase from mobile element jockey (Drosophila melanogaster) [Cotesia congregata]|uniref:Similar to pol: RNA-directed DNA polymerase from mobile element jockey (Drosophila melanogaster) n=1 Tax=Cotesia congregata TaxID=51543 RepID=A0A8J2H079_COTCN|nr:Similar to pol: RNA-directed DNA polymerase from mobile element jockey (Drosophila melanogaster) [Cotesia congregata]
MSLLALFGLNIDEDKFALAYADDMIVGLAGKQLLELQEKLEQLVNNINNVYKIWNLRINPDKCETIVFRRESNHLSKNALTQIKNFQISTPSPNTNEPINIPHKTIVKYLGVHIEQLLRLRHHPDIQLAKAKAAFKANNRIFYNKNICRKTKIICYLLLVRPILTYAAPIWWNTSAAVFENYRVFERKCLRACIGAYRSAESNFKKFIMVDSQLKTPQHRQAATTGTTQRTVDLTRIYTEKSLKIPPQLWHPNNLINPIKVY